MKYKYTTCKLIFLSFLMQTTGLCAVESYKTWYQKTAYTMGSWFTQVRDTWAKPVFSKVQSFFQKNATPVGCAFAGLCGLAGFYTFIKRFKGESKSPENSPKTNFPEQRESTQEKSTHIPYNKLPESSLNIIDELKEESKSPENSPKTNFPEQRGEEKSIHIPSNELPENTLNITHQNDPLEYPIEHPNEAQQKELNQYIKCLFVLPQTGKNCGYHAVSNALEVTENHLTGFYDQQHDPDTFLPRGLNETDRRFQDLKDVAYQVRLEKSVIDKVSQELTKMIGISLHKDMSDKIMPIARAIAGSAAEAFKTTNQFDLTSDDLKKYFKLQFKKQIDGVWVHDTTHDASINTLFNNKSFIIHKPQIKDTSYLAEEEILSILVTVGKTLVARNLLEKSDDIENYVSITSPTELQYTLPKAYKNFKQHKKHSFIVSEPTADHWYTLVAHNTKDNTNKYYLLDSVNPQNRWEKTRPMAYLIAHNLTRLALEDKQSN